jgi:hypothetical protein
MGGIRKANRILIGKPERKRSLGRHRRIILKMILIRLGGNVWTELI